MSAIVCGSSECPTCGRDSTALIGPCDACTEYFHEHGKFPRRRRAAAASGTEGDPQ